MKQKKQLSEQVIHTFNLNFKVSLKYNLTSVYKIMPTGYDYINTTQTSEKVKNS